MTIQELNKIIIDNFSDSEGNVDISELQFKHDLKINNLGVKGNLYQHGQKVEGQIK